MATACIIRFAVAGRLVLESHTCDLRGTVQNGEELGHHQSIYAGLTYEPLYIPKLQVQTSRPVRQERAWLCERRSDQ